MSIDLAVNDLYKVMPTTVLPPHSSINILHCIISNIAGGVMDQKQFADLLGTKFSSLYTPLMCTEAKFSFVQVQRLFPLPETLTVEGSPINAPGTATGDPLPTQTCGVITVQTGFAGRAQRGRSYIPYPAEGDLDPGPPVQPTAGYQTRLGTLAAHLIGVDSVTGSGVTVTYDMILYHRKTKTFDLLTAARENLKWGTQRRRGNYGASHR